MFRPVLAPGLRVRFEAGRAFIFVRRMGEILEFNTTAASVLRLCNGESCFSEIVKQICMQYKEVDHERVRKDTRDLLVKLRSWGIVTWDDSLGRNAS